MVAFDFDDYRRNDFEYDFDFGGGSDFVQVVDEAKSKNSRRRNLIVFLFLEKNKTMIRILFIIVIGIFFLNPILAQEEKKSKDFVFGFTLIHQPVFFELESSPILNLRGGIFFETEISPNLTNEIILGLFMFKEKAQIYNYTPTSIIYSNILTRSENTESQNGGFVRQRIKYRFNKTKLKPFIGGGIGASFIEAPKGQILQNSSPEVGPIFYSPEEHFLVDFNAGVGLDWYFLKHLFFTTSVDYSYILPYNLKKRYHTLSGVAGRVFSNPAHSISLRVGIGYNFSKNK